MRANRDAKRERQPWTGAAKQDVALPSRPLKRAGAALAGVLLLAAFAWLVWQVIRPAPRLIAATWTVGDYDLLSAPPLPFARQSLAEFRRIVADDSIARDTATSQTDEELTAFCKDMAQYRGAARDDLLVAFVIAHGVSAVEHATEPAREADNSGDGNSRSPEAAWRAVPYLLCSNYQPGGTSDEATSESANKTPEGMVPLDTLIDALAACRVGHKLLLLDCGSVESDPALGMLVNEFPKLLAEKVAATGDPNLCVLISHGVGQRSLVDRGKKASVFARCVNQAVAEHAERQGTRELTLAEFTDELAKKVEESAEQLTDGALSQKPTLLWGGGDRTRQSVVVMPRIGKGPAVEGDSAVPEADVKPATAQTRLLPIGDERLAVAQAAGQAAPAAAADSSPASNARPSSQSKQAAEQSPAQADELGRASAAVPAAAPTAGTTPTAGNPDPTHSDEKTPSTTEGEPRGEAKPENKTDKNRASEPKSVWESRWIECDRLTGGASVWSPIDFAPNAWRDYCERLVAAEQRDGLGLSIAPAALEEPAWDALAQAFAGQTARYEQHQDIVQAVRLRNELLFRLPYHIRWMTAGASTADDDTLGDLFPIRLFDDLANLVHSLADPPRTAKAGAADEVARWRAELRRQAANLETFQQKLDRRLSEEIATLTHPKRASNEGGDLPRIDNLLGTPLLTASERSRLHQTIAKKLARTSASDRPAKLWRRAELEWRLWNVIASPTPHAAGPEAQPGQAPSDFGSRLDDLVRQAPSTSPEAIMADEQPHQELWALGNLQRDTYRRLENNLFTLARATNNAARLADATLRLIDGRRAGQILKRRSDYDPIDPVNRPLLPDLGIKHSIELVRLLPRGGQAASLEIGKPSTLAWSVRYERPGTRKLTWWITYDDTADDVKLSFEDRPLASGQRHELTFQPDESKKELRCAVVPRREADRGPIEITLHVAASEAQAVTDGVAVSLPRRQPLRLVVAPGASATVSSLDHATLVELRPFFSPQPPDEPRPTRFRLTLVNDAPLGKQVTYQWFALPAEPETLRRAREGEDIAARSRPLAGTEKPLIIPAGGELPLDLPFPKPPVAAGGAAPADAPPPAPAGHDIAAGLVLDVVEVEVKAEGAAPVAKPRQRFVIQVAPKHPKEYLAPPKVEYLPLDEKLNITVEPIESGALPPDGTKVVWEMEDKRLKTAADKKAVAKLSPKNVQDTMYARLSPKPDETVEVQLTVDGYPRAFAYDVRCDEVAHAPSQNKLDYFKHIDMQIVRDKAGAGEPGAGPLIFGNVPSIRVRLRADAPREWFAAPNHRIEVGIETSDGPDGEPTRFAADRLVDLRAAAGTASRDWEILATVRDIELPLDTEGRADSRFDVVARLTPEPIEVRRTIILDGLAPQLRGLEAEVTGESISASVRAREASDAESGVNRVEFAVLKAVEWRKVKDDAAWPKVAQVESADRPGADGRWSIELKRPPEPGNYVVLARAFDNADNESEVGDYALMVSKPPSAKALAGDGKNSLFGTFTVRGGKPDPGANWRVSLKGPKNVGPIPANSGSYSFKGLPPGKYELKITGDFGKIETWGPREITIEAPPAKATVDRWDLGSDDGQAK